MLTQPGLSSRPELDKGLESPHAENILRELDMDGTVGLKTAPPELLDEAPSTYPWLSARARSLVRYPVGGPVHDAA